MRSIGRLAIKVEPAADNCIKTLLGLIETKVSYVVPEVIIVIKDIFRRYPGKYEGIIPTLCEHLDALEEPEAKAAMIWIVGQFADKIDNADELLEDLLYTFKEDPVEVCCRGIFSITLISLIKQVQLALLTAAVKLFIYKSQSDATKELVHKVLKWATEEVDNPDLRDRGFMYWRLLAINPGVAGEIVLAEKPAITTDSDRMDRGALDQLLLHTGTLGSIYHKNPEVSSFSMQQSSLLTDNGCTDIHTKCSWQSTSRLTSTERPFTSRTYPSHASHARANECQHPWAWASRNPCTQTFSATHPCLEHL